MTLIERLRDDARSESAICHEAADEIERLRAEIEDHRRSHAAIYRALGSSNPDRTTWPAEIGRLRADADSAAAASALLEQEIQRWLEIESHMRYVCNAITNAQRGEHVALMLGAAELQARRGLEMILRFLADAKAIAPPRSAR